MNSSALDTDVSDAPSPCPTCGADLGGPFSAGICLSCLLSPDALSPSVEPALGAGVALGPYQIVASLGAGGMGQVFRAWDTRLCRYVAIKMLPTALAADPQRIRRLEREARIVARLNHPHICAIHDIGHENGSPFIVMEFLEGETLADRLARGPMPLDDALTLAMQIADGLDRAHRHGIAHRDLKPANIMLTPSGVKLLDFGLAALRDEWQSPRAADASIERELRLAGTVPYMAPEQIEGEKADVRSDVFAFGLLLRELSNHPALDRVIAHCLRKDPEERWQSLRDVVFELTWIREELARQPAVGLPAPRRRVSLAFTLAATASIISLGLALALLSEAARRPAPARPVRFIAGPPIIDGITASSGLAFVSPDGQRLAWVVVGTNGTTGLAVQLLESTRSTYLAGTDGARWPFWSPDSGSIAFFAQGSLKRVSASGGPVDTIAAAAFGEGGSWSRDGSIVFAPSRTGPLMSIAAAGGVPRPITTLDQSRGELAHRWPTFLPDGRHFVYFASSDHPDARGLYVGDLSSSDRRWLGATDSGAAYAPTGHLLFTRGVMLLAQPFDVGAMRLTGDPFVVQERVYPPTNVGPPCFSLSSTGILVFHVARLFRHQLAWFNRSGGQMDIALEAGSYFSPVLSPDGSRVALERHDPNTWELGVWQFDLARKVLSRATETSMSISPLWSPDGKSIAFSSGRGEAQGIYRVASRGGKAELLLSDAKTLLLTDWSPDRRVLLFQTHDEATKDDVWVLPVEEKRRPFPYLRSRFNEGQARFSPNGRWIAYVSDESGRSEVYVQPFPATGERWQISNDGGREPTWRRDGRELFYLAADRRLMAVPVQTLSRFTVGMGAELFRFPSDAPTENRISYAPSPDGQRFLVNVAAPDRVRLPPLETNVVMNWRSPASR
jgi:eukaryotic-like serine/threonine-protein kinase